MQFAILIRGDIPDRPDAERFAAEFAARGHKRVHWAAPRGAGPRELNGELNEGKN